MNIKKNRNIMKFSKNILVAAFFAILTGCGSSQSDTSQNVNRAAPQNTIAEEKPTPTAAPVNPTAAIAGSWETKYEISKIIPGYPSSNLGTGNQYAQWKISEGVRKGDEYVGRITNELNNENIAEYTLVAKTITLKFLPVSIGGTQTSGTSRDYEFELTENGNMLTLKGNDPIVLTKGTNNSDMENVSFIISNKVDWMLSKPKTIDYNKPEAHYVTFETAQKFDNGYGGKMEFWQVDPNNSNNHIVVATGQYLLTSKDKVTITLGGPKSGTYKLLDNRVLTIDFTDPNEEDLVLTAR